MARGQNADVGAKRISQNGYEYVKVQDAGEGKPGWKLTHHVIAERKLGRPIRTDERVTFKDGKRSNLNPDNIVVVEKGKGSQRRRLAQIEARIQELQAERDEIIRTLRGPAKINHSR